MAENPTPADPSKEALLDKNWLQKAKISWPIFVAVVTIGGGFLWKIATDYTTVLKDIEFAKEQLEELDSALESLEQESIKQLHELDKRVERLEDTAQSKE